MLSIVLAVLAAIGNAVASVLQRRADAALPEDQSGGPIMMLWQLAHRRDWLGGIAAIIVGFLCQAAALATGPIALVQPILVLELAFALILAQVVFRSRLHLREWGAVIGMSAGLAVLLYALQPSGGDPAGAPPAPGSWASGSRSRSVSSSPSSGTAPRDRGERRTSDSPRESGSPSPLCCSPASARSTPRRAGAVS
jgi:hypothetical protein